MSSHVHKIRGEDGSAGLYPGLFGSKATLSLGIHSPPWPHRAGVKADRVNEHTFCRVLHAREV